MIRNYSRGNLLQSGQGERLYEFPDMGCECLFRPGRIMGRRVGPNDDGRLGGAVCAE